MRFQPVFSATAAALACLAVWWGGTGWLLLWPAASCLLVAMAYRLRWPGVFGKQPDGSMVSPLVLINLPFLLATWTVWHVARLVRGEPPAHEIRPGLWLGRRPYTRELPRHVHFVVDVTAEFPMARGVRRRTEVVCLPTLDGTAPRADDLCRAVDLIRRHVPGVLVHCASGRGRSTTVVAAYLIEVGEAGSPTEAEALIRTIRPGVRLTRPQRALLNSRL
jgi:protein-tyrosine phosphatase